MGMNLILRFRFRRGEAAQVRWARRIKFDGNGGLIVFHRQDATCERLVLSRLQDLRIQPFPIWVEGMEYRT